MRIKKERSTWHIFVFESEYNQIVVSYCQFLKNSFGFQAFGWDGANWRFSDPAIVLLMQDKFPELIVDPEVLTEIGIAQKEEEKSKEREENAERIKEGVSSGIEIRGIRGELYPYQRLGVEFFINSGGRALLADSPGCGKSVQALGFITHGGYKRSLVICPASVKFSWENEIDKWTNLKSFIIGPQTSFEDIPYDTNIIIINYDVLKKHFN